MSLLFVWAAAASAQVLTGDPLVAGSSAAFRVTGMPANATVALTYSVLGPGNGPCPPQLFGQCLGLRNPVVAQVAVANALGVANFSVQVPAAASGVNVWLQAGGTDGVSVGAVSGILQRTVGYPATVNLSTAVGQAQGSTSDDYLGDAVTGADFDGDGTIDLVVGMPQHTGSGAAAPGAIGKALIWSAPFTGNGHGQGDADAVITGVSGQAPGHFGDWAGVLPDLDGNGDVELAIGDSKYDASGGRGESGAVHIWFGLPTGAVSASTADLTIEGGASERLQSAYAGDATGDTQLDLLVPFSSGDGARLVAGPFAAGTVIDARSTYTARFSRSQVDSMLDQGALGDLDGDGVSDVVLGAWAYDDPSRGNNAEGRVYVEHGPVAGDYDMDPTADATITGDAVNGQFGHVVRTVDLDADGYDELVVGSEKYASPTYYGRVWIFEGSFAGAMSSSAAVATIDGVTTGQAIGTSVVVGDLDADGEQDLLVGSGDKSRVWWLAGPFSGAQTLDTLATKTEIRGTTGFTNLGEQDSVAIVGDVDGDGAQDLWLGEPENNLAGTNSGSVSLLYGWW